MDAYAAMASKEFSAWPIVVINYSLPPHQRTKIWNMAIVGLVPGPKTPKRLDTFFWPLLREFETLGKGVVMWNEYLQSAVLTKAYLFLGTSDMAARKFLMRTTVCIEVFKPCEQMEDVTDNEI